MCDMDEVYFAAPDELTVWLAEVARKPGKHKQVVLPLKFKRLSCGCGNEQKNRLSLRQIGKTDKWRVLGCPDNAVI